MVGGEGLSLCEQLKQSLQFATLLHSSLPELTLSSGVTASLTSQNQKKMKKKNCGCGTT